MGGTRPGSRVETCDIGATYEGNLPNLSNEYYKLPQPKSGLVETVIFLSTVKLTTNTPPAPTLLIGQVNNCRMELCGGTASVSNETHEQGHVVGTNFDVAADQQHDLSTTSSSGSTAMDILSRV
eukprot:5051067-Amphidinium_carterae.2